MDRSKKDERLSKYKFPMKLGNYTLTKLIGAGGMGEVFLAEDPICQRSVALKRIIPEQFHDKEDYTRFLSEPKIAAQLFHPSIIPIYNIHEEKDQLYYTMPYIEGETLYTILQKTKKAQEQGLPIHPVGSSIYALMLMFFNVCQAAHYAHSKGFLHRDLKAGNIMVRNFTQVVILDWGVATSIDKMEKYEKIMREEQKYPDKRLTAPGSQLGTIDYMAPERAFEVQANVKTDVYSLGVILYFILTLEEPFDRVGSMIEWRKQINENGPEPIIPPHIKAPDREITPELSRITLKCLSSPSKRYSNVKELIDDIQRYIEGNPEWIAAQQFQLNRKEDWLFQENILLAKHVAISKYAGTMEWVVLMLSKESYSGNIQLSTTVKLQKDSDGIGFLMSIPEGKEQKSLENGCCIWIGSKKHPGCQFLRSGVEMASQEDTYLEPDKNYILSVERQENTFRLFINAELILTYTHHIPIFGGRFGLLLRDLSFGISPITLSIGSQNVQINCLSIPDAFLMIKDYSQALTEYQRIAHSFKGRAEGRKAIFRAGLTLIEMGKSQKSKNLFSKALEEFEKLHKTPGAALEYLGKSLVYRAEENLEEEIKCLELALRMYPKNPLIHLVEEHLMFRLHETSQKDRMGAYTFALLIIRQLPSIYEKKEMQNFIQNLTVNWETLPFIFSPPALSSQQLKRIDLSSQLAFWLAHPTSLYELTQEIPPTSTEHLILLENCLLALFTLGYPHLVDFILKVKYRNENSPEFLKLKNTLEVMISKTSTPEKLDKLLPQTQEKVLSPLLMQALTIQEAPKILPYFEKASLSKPLWIWALLLSGNLHEADQHLQSTSPSDTSSLCYMLKGCCLAALKGKKSALLHFDQLMETPSPQTPTFLGHFLKGHINLTSGWIEQAFLWEKLQLYRQLALYYACLGEIKRATQFEDRIQKEVLKSQIPLNFI